MEKIITLTFDTKTGECKISAQGFTPETHELGAKLIMKLLDSPKELIKGSNFNHSHENGFVHNHS